MICAICGLPMSWDGITTMTAVGYDSEPEHDHDDNCLKRIYVCQNGHSVVVSKRRTCPFPGCDWKGKEECFCHPGKKVDEWPDVMLDETAIMLEA